MFAASTYEEIVQREQEIENMEIVVFLFVKPTNQDGRIIRKGSSTTGCMQANDALRPNLKTTVNFEQTRPTPYGN